MRLLPSGERAVLVELAVLDEVLALAEPVRMLAGVEDVVPGERTLLVTVVVPGALETVRRALPEVARASASAVATPRTVEIHVTYDGPDLEAVAAHTGLSVAEVVQLHTATPWRVGFGHAGRPARTPYRLARRPRPRRRVDRGARLEPRRRPADRPRLAASPHRRTPQRGRRTRLHPATPDGRPVLFGPDHPTTGGYPVVGVLTQASCDLLAQLRPGQRVRFRAVAK